MENHLEGEKMASSEGVEAYKDAARSFAEHLKENVSNTNTSKERLAANKLMNMARELMDDVAERYHIDRAEQQAMLDEAKAALSEAKE